MAGCGSMETQRGGSSGIVAPARTDVDDVAEAARSSRPNEANKQVESGKSGGFCPCLRRRQEPMFKQFFVVLRHSVRQDYVDKSYKTSPEGLKWPHDAPLTKEGHDLASEVADELLEVHKKAKFITVACSPYRRCMETAAQVAKKLGLPVVLDQEIGEVRERSFPEDHVVHRSPKELADMAKALDIKLLNPLLDDGGVKLFGKEPVWPETLDGAKDRYIVRMETYIRKSAEEKQNMILVTHADAVVAALVMFERGGADVQHMGFCARVIVSRDVKESEASSHGVFSKAWAVDPSRLGADIFHEEDAKKAKIYENQHLETCDETEVKVTQRRKKRTQTDFMFDSTLKKAAAAQEMADLEEEEAEEAAEEAGTGKPGGSSG